MSGRSRAAHVQDLNADAPKTPSPSRLTVDLTIDSLVFLICVLPFVLESRCNAKAKHKPVKVFEITNGAVLRFRQFATFRQKANDGYAYLKRCLPIFSALIFDSRVDEGMPSLAAAPRGPETRPLVSAKAASINSFSRTTRFSESNSLDD